MTLTPEVIECSSFAEIDAAIERLIRDDPSRWIFRGHRNTSWRLASRLERETPISKMLAVEHLMLSEFSAKAHLYADRLPSDSSDDMLSVMQHFGIPTRLLDWSYSAFVALYFAVEEECNDSPLKCALWAVDSAVLYAVRSDLLKYHFGTVQSAGVKEIYAWESKHSDEAEKAGNIELVIPHWHVSRLASQQGCFLINHASQFSFEESLARMMEHCANCWLQKITFPASLRVQILRRLIHLNIHPATLFPDLDGLARFIRLKHVTLHP